MRFITSLRIPYQRHPDLRLQTYWNGIQLAILAMPFSALLGSVAVSLISLILFWKLFRRISQRGVNQGFAIVGILMIMSAALAYRQSDALLGLANFLPFLIIFAALSELIQSLAQMRRLAWIIAITSVPVVVIGLGQQFLGWSGHVQIFGSIVDWVIDPTGNPPGRMASIFFYANVLASYLVITFILSLGLLIGEIQRAREKESGVRVRRKFKIQNSKFKILQTPIPHSPLPTSLYSVAYSC